MYEKFEALLKKYGVTAYRVSKETGVTTATLMPRRIHQYVQNIVYHLWSNRAREQKFSGCYFYTHFYVY